MALIDKLNQDIKEAMKSGDKNTLKVVRMIKSSLDNEKIKLGKDVTEDDELSVLNREMKQRKESLDEFAKAKRDDLVNDVSSEIDVLKSYLPEQLDNDQVKKIVNETISEVKAGSSKDIGKVMSALTPKIKGKADGKTVSDLVKEMLGK